MGAAMLAPLSLSLSSCSDDNDDYDTNQYKGGVSLNSFGPSPVARGGELRFLGSGMNRITSVTIPGCEPISQIEVIDEGEIRVTVPQTAEPGYLTLSYSGGTITTKTMLTYTEPISIDGFSPARIKPGNELTISGEYLNLINEVCFAFETDSVNVFADDFTAHSRKEIKLIVPEEAVSGIIIISDAAAVPNTLKSEDELEVILPSVSAPLDLTDVKGGTVVTIAGDDLDLVRRVELPSGEEVDFEYDADASTISFTLPDDVTDGAIVAIPASGVKVAVANIGVVVPTELEAQPAEGLRAGDALVIKGVNIDQVTTVLFPGMEDAVEPTAISATQLTVTVPAEAQSGDLVLNLRSGKTVSLAIATAKPEEIAFTPDAVAANAEFKITGKNLDLVTSITFTGDVEVAVENPSATEITVTAPATAQTGNLVLHMANGESVETPQLTILLPECAYVESVATEEPMAGELLVLNIANADKLTDVKVNGTSVQYISNNNVLYVALPSSCGAGTVVTLISSNGEISYTYDVTPATHVEIVAYDEGPVDMGNWEGNFRIYKDKLDGVPAGAIMTIHVAPYGDYSQLQLNDANWSSLAFLNFGPDDTTIEVELTAEILAAGRTVEDGWSETAFVFNGCNCVVNKVTLAYEQDLGTTVFEGPVDLTWDDTGRFGLALNFFEGLKAGATITFYITQNDNWGQIQINNGCWSTLYFDELGGGYLSTDAIADKSATEYTLTLTQSVLDDILNNPGDYWGLNTAYQNGDTRVGMVIQGSDMRVNKIVVNK